MFTLYLPAALKQWAKAINTALAAITIIVVHGVITGEWDTVALEAAIGLLVTGVVFATPNG